MGSSLTKPGTSARALRRQEREKGSRVRVPVAPRCTAHGHEFSEPLSVLRDVRFASGSPPGPAVRWRAPKVKPRTVPSASTSRRCGPHGLFPRAHPTPAHRAPGGTSGPAVLAGAKRRPAGGTKSGADDLPLPTMIGRSSVTVIAASAAHVDRTGHISSFSGPGGERASPHRNSIFPIVLGHRCCSLSSRAHCCFYDASRFLLPFQ